MAIGGLGSLFGMLKGTPDAPSYADLDLAKENPDLWKELQRLQAVNRQYDDMFAARRAGANASELAQLAQGRSQVQDQLANRGLIGSSAGTSMQAGADAQMQGQIQERAFQEMMAMQQARQQAQAQYAQQLAQGQQMAMQPMQAQHQQGMQGDADRNQFFGGLLGAGLQMYGANQYLQQQPQYQYGAPQAQQMGGGRSPAFVNQIHGLNQGNEMGVMGGYYPPAQSYWPDGAQEPMNYLPQFGPMSIAPRSRY